jgi:hypothetical protein
LNEAVAMKAPALALALFLAHGCAPAQLVAGSVRGDPETGNVCTAHEHCGLGGGGTGTVALPMGIMLAAFATPALIYLLL